jgi:hypothetical protein
MVATLLGYVLTEIGCETIDTTGSHPLLQYSGSSVAVIHRSIEIVISREADFALSVLPVWSLTVHTPSMLIHYVSPL